MSTESRGAAHHRRRTAAAATALLRASPGPTSPRVHPLLSNAVHGTRAPAMTSRAAATAAAAAAAAAAAPKLGVAVTLLNEAMTRCVLVKRGKEPAKGQWSLCGGTVELGETVAEAAQREVLEETGLETRLPAADAAFTVSDAIFRDGATGAVSYHYALAHLLAFPRPEGAAPVAADDAADARWFTMAEIEAMSADGTAIGTTHKIVSKAVRMVRADLV